MPKYYLWRMLPTLIVLGCSIFWAIRWYQRHRIRRKMEQEGRLKPRSHASTIPAAALLLAAVAGLLVLLTSYRDNVMAIGVLLLVGTGIGVVAVLRGDSAISQAQRWMAAGNTRAAIEGLETAVAQMPSARRWAVLADCHAVRGDHRRAAECYGKAQDLDEQRLDYAARQVLHLQLAGEWESAANELAAWREKYPEQMSFALLACRQHIAADQIEFACEQLRQVMELASVAGGEQRSHIPGLMEECAQRLRDDMAPRAFEVRTTPPPPPPPHRS